MFGDVTKTGLPQDRHRAFDKCLVWKVSDSLQRLFDTFYTALFVQRSCGLFCGSSVF